MNPDITKWKSIFKEQRNMKKFIITLIILATASCYAYSQEMKSAEEIAIEMVNKMETQLNLEPHQTFFVDSVLCHDYRAWMDENEDLRNAGVQEPTVYISIREKWQAHIDSSLVKILNPDQWTEYLKMTGKYKKPKKDKKSGKN